MSTKVPTLSADRLQDYQRRLLKECSTSAGVTIVLRALLEEQATLLEAAAAAERDLVGTLLISCAARLDPRDRVRDDVCALLRAWGLLE